MSILLLDALNIPAPSRLVADCKAVGASGCWAYAWRPWGSPWTPAHVEALHEAGLYCPAIIVPGNGPGPWSTIVNSASALGCDPITAFDIETNSLPPAEWLAGAIAYTRQLGRRPVRYGDAPVLSGYPQADGDWISHRPGLIVRAGQITPIPAVPAGTIAWQYAVGCLVNGTEYDASTADESVFGGDDGGLNVAVADDILTLVQAIYRQVAQDASGHDISPETFRSEWTSVRSLAMAGVVTGTDPANSSVNWLRVMLDNIEKAASNPVVSAQVSAADVATALAGNATFTDAVATAVAHKLGTLLAG